MNVLEARQIGKKYNVGDRVIEVLDNVTLFVPAGEFLAISGKSGSGKSTLLSILSGLDKPTAGRVAIDGEDVTDLSEDRLAPVRNEKIGFVFQSFHLVPSLSALENVMFPAELRGDPDAGKRAETLLRRTGLADRRDNFPHQLSGGEKQRVAICRALINYPKIVFADEPTGNLDSSNSEIVVKLLTELVKDLGTTLVLATHSREISGMADRVVTIGDGRLKKAVRNTDREAGGARRPDGVEFP
jgi:putative ABC transport system ATP-binding protein